MGARAIGVMGGTFDPIHHGHLVAASEVQERCGLDLVIFMPAGDPWQKITVASPEDRYLMTAMAVADDDRFTVSRMEIDRDGPTYTVETLRLLSDELGPGARLHFIAGADAVRGFTQWHRYSEILDLARLVVVTRPGHAPQTDLPQDRVSVVEIPALQISSTQIRERVRQGRSIAYLVPSSVAAYIRQRRLYAAPGRGDG